jgi:hypothetical protein
MNARSRSMSKAGSTRILTTERLLIFRFWVGKRVRPPCGGLKFIP